MYSVTIESKNYMFDLLVESVLIDFPVTNV